MSVISKCAKIRAKREALHGKLKTSSLINGSEHFVEFIKAVLERCLEKEGILQNEKGVVRKATSELKEEVDEGHNVYNGQFAKVPEEVVEMILELLDSKDLANLSKTCKLFEGILEPKKPTWLFHKIIPFIACKAYLSLKDVIKSRYACKKWKRAVDDFIQNLNMPSAVVLPCSHKTVLRQYQTVSLFGDAFYPPLKSTDLERFPLLMENHPGNPFVGRKLRLGFKYGRQVEMMGGDRSLYWERAIDLLTRFGHNLWACELIVESMSLKDKFQTIRNCVEKAPNIKTLSIAYLDEILYNPTPKQVAEGEQYLVDNPFPPLPNLVSLELHLKENLLYKHVFPVYSQQLLKLRLRVPKNTGLPFTTGNDLVQFENLTELHIHLDSVEDSSRLLFLHCPKLISLQLVISKWRRFAQGSAPLRLKMILRILQHFGGNLQVLDLSVGSMTNDFTPQQYFKAMLQISFPHLQMVSLAGWTVPLDILLGMPCLQYVKLENGFVQRAKHFEQKFVKKYGGMVIEMEKLARNPYISNIWSVVPSIVEIKLGVESKLRKVTTTSYTREGYEGVKEIFPLPNARNSKNRKK